MEVQRSENPSGDSVNRLPTPEYARLKAGLLIGELAAKAGVSASSISRIERGECKNLRPRTLMLLSRALQVDYMNLALNVRKVTRSGKAS